MNNAFFEWFEGFIAACSEDGPTISQWKVITAKLKEERMKQTGATRSPKIHPTYRELISGDTLGVNLTRSSGEAL